jgi:hypothetical protein
MAKASSTLGTPAKSILEATNSSAVVTPDPGPTSTKGGTPGTGTTSGGTAAQPDATAFYHGGQGKNITPDVGVKGGQTPEPAHE